MAKSKMTRDLLPNEFQTIEEAAEFWDTHSLADYEYLQQDADFEVELRLETNYFAKEATSYGTTDTDISKTPCT